MNGVNFSPHTTHSSPTPCLSHRHIAWQRGYSSLYSTGFAWLTVIFVSPRFLHSLTLCAALYRHDITSKPCPLKGSLNRSHHGATAKLLFHYRYYTRYVSLLYRTRAPWACNTHIFYSYNNPVRAEKKGYAPWTTNTDAAVVAQRFLFAAVDAHYAPLAAKNVFIAAWTKISHNKARTQHSVLGIIPPRLENMSARPPNYRYYQVPRPLSYAPDPNITHNFTSNKISLRFATLSCQRTQSRPQKQHASQS